MGIIEVQQPEPLPMQLETLEEVAVRLRKSEAQLRWMIHNGSAPRSAKIGGRRLFKTTDVNDFINAAFDAEATA